MKEILVETLMTRAVDCLSPDTALRHAVDKMVGQRYSCIVIVETGSPIGILTERDLVKVLAGSDHENNLIKPVAEFMTSPVHSLNQSESLFDALVVTKAEKVRHLPVVNNSNELVGLVTHTDLANAHFHVTEMQSKLIEEAITNKTQVLQQVNEELQALSMEDHLMEIGNRRAMEVDLNHTHAAALRYDHQYSLILADIDYFKRYNDKYGHQKGDEILKQVGKTIEQNIRSCDRLYRYGGEELLLILPHTNAEQSTAVADKLIEVLRASEIIHEDSPLGLLTISCGSSSVLESQDSKREKWENVVGAADIALYAAKADGRNRVVTALPKG